jgi:hypothetical protein
MACSCVCTRSFGRGEGCFYNACCPVTAPRPANEATVGTDTLAKADRLAITYVHQEISAHSASTQPLIPPAPIIVPPVETKIISRHWHDPYATTSSGAKSKQPKKMAATEKGKSVDPKGNQAADRQLNR